MPLELNRHLRERSASFSIAFLPSHEDRHHEFPDDSKIATLGACLESMQVYNDVAVISIVAETYIIRVGRRSLTKLAVF